LRVGEVLHVLVNKLIIVLTKTKDVILTLYPSSKSNLQWLDANKSELKQVNRTKKVKKIKDIIKRKDIVPSPFIFNKIQFKKEYPDPQLLSFSISDTKKKIHITINYIENPYNLAGCFGSIEKAQKFIDDYTEFYNSKIIE